MSRLILLMVLLVPATGGTALDGLPGTMNFRNLTTLRVNQTTNEQASNEKHVEVGDFDEDGDLDVVIAVAYSDFNARRNKLYRNDEGVMNEITASGAIPGFASNRVSRIAFLRDFNMDTHLDIWIINDSNSHLDQMFIADWNGGEFNQFDEVFNRVVSGGSMSTGAACSGWSADFNLDGTPDVYCGNYPNTSQDRLLSNDGSGFFNDLTTTHVFSSGDYVVDVNGADMNNDGQLDLLVSEHGGSLNRIYYNNNLNAGSGTGDFRYTGSHQFLVNNPTANENSMDAADFDGDGDQDVYWSNAMGASGDRILINNGPDGNNKALLEMLNILPASVTSAVSRKVEVADLNNDGRIDAFVAKENGHGRPTVLRNVTVNDNIEFVDWTPASAFPTGQTHTGWNAAVFDTNLDGDLDIFLGGWVNEHLFEAVSSTEYLEAELKNNVVPVMFDKSAVAVVGESGPSSPDLYIHNGMGADSFMSVVVNGADDYLVELLDGNDALLATIDRGGIGVEEATQYDPAVMPTTVKVRVTAQACASPYNVSGDCGVGIIDFLDLLAAWGFNPGHPADFDGDDFVGITDFLDLLANWGASTYIAEFLARSG